jgi:hypothetical protein
LKKLEELKPFPPSRNSKAKPRNPDVSIRDPVSRRKKLPQSRKYFGRTFNVVTLLRAKYQLRKDL